MTQPDLIEQLRFMEKVAIGPFGATAGNAAAEIARLRAAIQRIDGINDNPADFNSEINAVCDTILRPALKDTTP